MVLTLCAASGLAEPADVSPVVVELFMSQGCSSCPPAEKLLTELKQKHGAAILPLTYHVDYWDRAGWTDPFSDRRYTQRQQEYTYAFHENSLYTPEMVIQGETGFVGSRSRQAESEIAGRLNTPRPRFEIKATPGSWSGKADFTFSIPASLARKTDTITIVIFENKPPVKVLRGENAGETMSGEFAVRRLETQAVNKSGQYHVQLPLEAGAVRNKTGVAVLLQGGVHEIIAAESIYPLDGSDAT